MECTRLPMQNRFRSSSGKVPVAKRPEEACLSGKSGRRKMGIETKEHTGAKQMLKIWGRKNSINVMKVLWACDELVFGL